MFVFNDCTTDARVLREAGSLVAAGHQVTILARPRDLASTDEEIEERDGFVIVRVPVASEWRAWWIAARRPWGARLFVKQTVATEIRRVPEGWLKLAGFGLAGLVALPFAIARLAATRLRQARHRSAPPGGGTVEYLGRWAFTTLGWARAAARRSPSADVYHGHDLTGLPAAVWAASRNDGRVIYDSHEIFMESGGHVGRPRAVRALFAGLERRWSSRAAALVTVNRSVAEELDRRLHPARIVVVYNCAPRWDPPPRRPDLLRAAAGIPHDAAIALYHGGLTRHRGIEQLAEALARPGLERVHGVLMGYGSERETYVRLAQEGRFGGRLHYLPAVPPEELIPWVASADVGVMAIQRSSLNHWLATPNKLFECLAAGVPVVASDFPEMHRIVGEDPAGPLGVLCDPRDIGAVADAIRTIVDAPESDREALRARCLRAAHDRWNWETEAAGLLALYQDDQRGRTISP